MCSACDEGLYMYMRIQIRRRSTIRPPPNERRPMIATVASPACPPSARSAQAIRPSARESNMPRVVRLDASDETGGCASCHHADTRDIRRCASRASSTPLDPKAPRHYMPAPLARRSTPQHAAARCGALPGERRAARGARRLATTADDQPRHRALTKRRGHLAVPRRFNRRSERALPPARCVAAPGVRLSSIRSARSARATTALRRADAASACQSSRGSRARSSLRASAGNRDARSSR